MTKWISSALLSFFSCFLGLIIIFAIICLARPAHAADNDAADNDDDILFEADRLIHNQEEGYVEAIGNTQFAWRDYLLSADRARYYQNGNIVEAWGHAILVGAAGAIIFAQKIRFVENWNQGDITNLALLFEDDSRITARSAKRNIYPEVGVRTQMRRATYSPCKVCENKPGYPLWQITAGRVVHHEESKMLYYNNIFLEFFGVPVLYLPILSHPDPSVKRKTGLLIPTIRNSSRLGVIFSQPIYFNLTPQIGAQITPTITTRQGFMVEAEWRHILKQGAYNIKSSLAQGYHKNRQERPDGEVFGGHLFSNGKFKIGQNGRWAYSLQLASTEDYLQFFGISGQDTLTSDLSAQWKKDAHFISISNYVFRNLRESSRSRDPSTLVLPFIQYEARPQQEFLGGHLTFATSLLSILREHIQQDVTRWSLEASWQDELIGPLGSVFNFYGRARYDLYSRHCNSSGGLDEPCEEKKQTLTRILPLAMLDWRWPFFHASALGQQILEPAVQLIYAPYRSARKNFPNEDSQAFTFSAGNLFTPERFSGIDQWEAGPRMNVQLQWTAYQAQYYSLSVLLGQVFRLKDSRDFDEVDSEANSGLRNKSSDIVSRATLSFPKFGTMTHRFRFNRSDFALQRYDADLDFALGPVGLFVGYAQRQASSSALPKAQEVYAGAAIRFGQYWRAYGDIRRDLVSNRSVTNSFGLLYDDECLKADLSFRQSFTTNGAVKPDLLVGFRISFKNLGSLKLSTGASFVGSTNFAN